MEITRGRTVRWRHAAKPAGDSARAGNPESRDREGIGQRASPQPAGTQERVESGAGSGSPRPKRRRLRPAAEAGPAGRKRPAGDHRSVPARDREQRHRGRNRRSSDRFQNPRVAPERRALRGRGRGRLGRRREAAAGGRLALDPQHMGVSAEAHPHMANTGPEFPVGWIVPIKFRSRGSQRPAHDPGSRPAGLGPAKPAEGRNPPAPPPPLGHPAWEHACPPTSGPDRRVHGSQQTSERASSGPQSRRGDQTPVARFSGLGAVPAPGPQAQPAATDPDPVGGSAPSARAQGPQPRSRKTKRGRAAHQPLPATSDPALQIRSAAANPHRRIRSAPPAGSRRVRRGSRPGRRQRLAPPQSPPPMPAVPGLCDGGRPGRC